jgi:hypothetical protein
MIKKINFFIRIIDLINHFKKESLGMDLSYLQQLAGRSCFNLLLTKLFFTGEEIPTNIDPFLVSNP